MPFNGTIATAILNTILGAIYVGSSTAFNAFVGSFILHTTASYTLAILPHLLTGRKNIEVYGPFHLKGLIGFLVNGIACTYMIVFFVIYCFPFFLPTDAGSMNYAVVIWGGFTVMISAWWFFAARKDYVGPPIVKQGGKVTEAETVRDIEQRVWSKES